MEELGSGPTCTQLRAGSPTQVLRGERAKQQPQPRPQAPIAITWGVQGEEQASSDPLTDCAGPRQVSSL